MDRDKKVVGVFVRFVRRFSKGWFHQSEDQHLSLCM
jgi:hypothetical protein